MKMKYVSVGILVVVLSPILIILASIYMLIGCANTIGHAIYEEFS